MKWFKDFEVILIGFFSGGMTLMHSMPKHYLMSFGGALAVTGLMSMISFLGKKAGELLWNKYIEKKGTRKRKKRNESIR